MSRLNFIPEQTDELKEWHKKLGVKFFKEIGVQQGDYVFDFGCGSGTYTLPAAEVVGSKGKVFAIDVEQVCIDEIKDSLITNQLKEIVVPIKTDGGFSFPIESNSIDFALFVDVIGVIIHHKKSLKAIEDLFLEIVRLLKSSGIVAILFKHVRQWRHYKNEVDLIISKNFSLIKQLDIRHIHWDYFENDLIYLYKKK
ncbi:MAG: class I SAM-dependent methyltransferase [Asgard group archaeon]|nr:class I SAM-dependent methyltransferase [Asgard group archaeon]